MSQVQTTVAEMIYYYLALASLKVPLIRNCQLPTPNVIFTLQMENRRLHR